MRKFVVFSGTATLLLLLNSALSPVNAQVYHENYGNGRVCRQNQIGLYQPAATQIGAGTMSRSARGLAPGMTVGFAQSATPTVSWGGFVRQPGDGLYNGSDGTVRMGNGSLNYGDNVIREEYMRMRKELMMARRQQMVMPQRQQQGNFYVPGSNGGAANYGSGSAMGYGSYR